jgi:hypothetical protein
MARAEEWWGTGVLPPAPPRYVGEGILIAAERDLVVVGV